MKIIVNFCLVITFLIFSSTSFAQKYEGKQKDIDNIFHKKGGDIAVLPTLVYGTALHLLQVSTVI